LKKRNQKGTDLNREFEGKINAGTINSLYGRPKEGWEERRRSKVPESEKKEAERLPLSTPRSAHYPATRKQELRDRCARFKIGQAATEREKKNAQREEVDMRYEELRCGSPHKKGEHRENKCRRRLRAKKESLHFETREKASVNMRKIRTWVKAAPRGGDAVLLPVKKGESTGVRRGGRMRLLARCLSRRGKRWRLNAESFS